MLLQPFDPCARLDQLFIWYNDDTEIRLVQAFSHMNSQHHFEIFSVDLIYIQKVFLISFWRSTIFCTRQYEWIQRLRNVMHWSPSVYAMAAVTLGIRLSLSPWGFKLQCSFSFDISHLTNNIDDVLHYLMTLKCGTQSNLFSTPAQHIFWHGILCLSNKYFVSCPGCELWPWFCFQIFSSRPRVVFALKRTAKPRVINIGNNVKSIRICVSAPSEIYQSVLGREILFLLIPRSISLLPVKIWKLVYVILNLFVYSDDRL